MSYRLGIDAGTTFTAAAIHRDRKVEMVALGDRSASIPSVIFLQPDGSILTGYAANQWGLSAPERVAVQFKRRVGDAIPLLLGGTPHSPESLMAKLFRWTVDKVSELEGGRPEAVAVSHPANWGPFKLDRLAQALQIADLEGAITLSEPEAAAIHYASNARVEPGSTIAVYDLGGGTFDAAVLRKAGKDWKVLGTPEGIEQLGGIDVDEAVFEHVRRTVPDAFGSLDPEDPPTRSATAALRRSCVEAKELLSSHTEAAIPVILPGTHSEVRLTRSELETMIRPTLEDTIGAMRRSLRSAGLAPAEITAILLVGGSSRIPMVAELVSQTFERPVAVDAHPKHAVALGAALAAAAESGQLELIPTVVPEPAPKPERRPDPEPQPKEEEAAEVVAAVDQPQEVHAESAQPALRRLLASRRAFLVSVGAIAGAAGGLVGVVIAGDGGGPSTTTTAATTTATQPTTSASTTIPSGGWETYDQAAFVEDCTDEQRLGGRSEATARSFCECFIDEMSDNVEFDLFEQWDLDLQTDPDTPMPEAIAAAIEPCLPGGGGGGT